MKPDLSRRQFLVHSAGIASASLGLPSSMPAGGRSPARRGLERGGASEQVRLGFIGLGDRGRYLLAAALGAAGSSAAGSSAAGSSAAGSSDGVAARVTALCDVNPKHLKRSLDLFREGGENGARPRAFSNWRALLDEREVDAVVIATPVHLHAVQTIASLAAGKHVYCEKPMAHAAEECHEVLAAARSAAKSGVVFQTGFQRRYNQRYRESVRFIRSGEAGKVLFVRAQWHATGNPPRDKPWIFQREKSGGIVLEQACHQFDVFNWLFGAPPVRACGFGGTMLAGDPPGRDTMDHYGAVIEYPGGVKVHFSHVSFAIPDRRFSGIYELVFGERLGVDLSNAVAWGDGGATRQLLAGAAAAAAAGGCALNDTQLAVRSFLASVLTGNRPEAGAEEGFRATLAALLCQRAIETGQVAHWSETGPA